LAHILRYISCGITDQFGIVLHLQAHSVVHK
jgi:hypothetical protein